MGPGEALVGRVRPVRVGEPAVGLEQPMVPVVEPPLRPAPDDLGAVELLERDSLSAQAGDVVGERDRGIARGDVETAGPGDDPDAGLRLELGPRGVGPLREADVVRSVVGQADDPAVVLARPVDVAELELLEAEDPIAEPAAEPVGGSAADPAEPDDDRVPVAPRSPVRSTVTFLPPIDG